MWPAGTTPASVGVMICMLDPGVRQTPGPPATPRPTSEFGAPAGTDSVALLVEQPPLKRKAVGSIPTRVTEGGPRRQATPLKGIGRSGIDTRRLHPRKSYSRLL